MTVLSNTKGGSLTPHDEELMEEIANAGKRVKFQGNDPPEQRELGRAAAGLLPSHIVKSFRDREASIKLKGTGSKRKFVLYSAHDYTIMAVLSHLGFRDWPIPKFASHLIFELHQVEGKFVVRLCFNPNPAVKQEYEYKSIPLDDASVKWEAVKPGEITLDQFEHVLMNVRRSFKTEAEWKADGDSVELPPGKSAGGDD